MFLEMSSIVVTWCIVGYFYAMVASFYGPDQMHQTKRASFYEWYDEQRDVTFDLQRELEKYCISDVDILQRCCGVLQKPLCRKHGVGTVHEDVYDSRGLQPGLQDEFPGTGHDRRHPIHRFI